MVFYALNIGTLPEEDALRYFTEMMEGYKSIFSNNAFHRDLKVVLENNLALKFID